MEKDKCIVCGLDTQYEQSLDIEFRQHYVEGAGQLCTKCHKDIYDTENQD
jgi:hypothetical protein